MAPSALFHGISEQGIEEVRGIDPGQSGGVQDGIEDAGDVGPSGRDVAAKIDPSKDRDPEEALGAVIGDFDVGVVKEDDELVPLPVDIGEGLSQGTGGAYGGMKHKLSNINDEAGGDIGAQTLSLSNDGRAALLRGGIWGEFGSAFKGLAFYFEELIDEVE